jgi:hypothetical protein
MGKKVAAIAHHIKTCDAYRWFRIDLGLCH